LGGKTTGDRTKITGKFSLSLLPFPRTRVSGQVKNWNLEAKVRGVREVCGKMSITGRGAGQRHLLF
jgi:hypothetical protein